MFAVDSAMDRDRIPAAFAAAAVQALLLLVLIAGLSVDVPAAIESRLKLFAISAVPPLPAPKPVPAEPARKHAAKAAPPNLRSNATPIVSPPPFVPIEIPPLIATAPIAATGSDQSTGASIQPGPGTGSGGVGAGTGSGGDGEGDGGITPSVQIKGRITGADYPRAAARAHIEGTLTTRYTVGPDGRVSDCVIEQSSGSAELDETTCRLVIERYRYRPARNREGSAVPDVWTKDHVWVIGR